MSKYSSSTNGEQMNTFDGNLFIILGDLAAGFLKAVASLERVQTQEGSSEQDFVHAPHVNGQWTIV